MENSDMRRLIVRKQTASHGFTLVELLIVISIIGVLVALLMPAINAARESGRRAQCMNNAAQLAKACAQHETAQTCFPGGGWGWGWTGDADGGVGMHQPGGWIYNILPYIDQADMHDLGKGLGTGKVGDGAKNSFHTQRVGKPLSITICPTRRSVRAFTCSTTGFINFSPPTPALVGRSDYASNGGDILSNPGTIGVWSSPCGGSPECGPASPPDDTALAQAKDVVNKYNNSYGPTGIDFPLSSLTSASVKTGASYCYLLGEKSLDPGGYTTGTSKGDTQNEYVGHGQDIARWVVNLPIQDSTVKVDATAFGSAHSAGFNMAFCDGSVRKMNYSIDLAIHRQLGNRLGTAVDPVTGTPLGPLTQLQKLNDVSNQ
jgi:prepilin-type N-terminal cleavage/methylation domain-containing protein/prepilin-type processing-associated H-X9-DG protein